MSSVEVIARTHTSFNAQQHGQPGLLDPQPRRHLHQPASYPLHYPQARHSAAQLHIIGSQHTPWSA
jgi:hypothetical protein